MAPKFLTPQMANLLNEFLTSLPEQSKNEEVKRVWSEREDMAKEFLLYAERRDAVEDAAKHDSSWVDEMSQLFPDALFWQFALFRICGRRAARRLELKETQESNAKMAASSPFYGMF